MRGVGSGKPRGTLILICAAGARRSVAATASGVAPNGDTAPTRAGAGPEVAVQNCRRFCHSGDDAGTKTMGMSSIGLGSRQAQYGRTGASGSVGNTFANGLSAKTCRGGYGP